MINDQLFHVYKKNCSTTEVVEHSLTVDELEERLVDKRVNLVEHEVLPVQIDYLDASY